jgi:hypothetical protein
MARFDPSKGSKYTLKTLNGEKGIVNLGDNKLTTDDLKGIKDLNKKIVDKQVVHIYFPAFENYFVKTYRSKNGFTLRKILNLINDTGYIAMYEAFKLNPKNFFTDDIEEAASSIGEFAVMTFNIDDNNIYVNIEH